MSTCLTSSVRRKDEPCTCDAWFKQHNTLTSHCEISKSFRAEVALACRTSVGSWEVLYASDGILLTVDGDVILVKKR